MGELLAGAVVVLATFMGLRYCYLIRERRVEPSLVTWIIFLVVSASNLYIYLSSPQMRNPMANIGNFADVPLVVLVVTVLLSSSRRREYLGGKWTDVLCLLLTTGIMTYWWVSAEGLIASIALQVTMAISYAPTICKLILEKRNTESFAIWLAFLAQALIALTLAYDKGDLFAKIYQFRAVGCMLVLLGFMTYYWWRERKERA